MNFRIGILWVSLSFFCSQFMFGQQKKELGKARNYLMRAEAMFAFRNHTDSITFYGRKAERIFEKYGDWENWVKSRSAIMAGEVYVPNFRGLNYASNYLQETIKRAEAHLPKTSLALSAAYVNWGHTLTERELFDSAMYAYEIALENYSTNKKANIIEYAVLLNNMGLTEENRSNFSQAESYFFKALELRDKVMSNGMMRAIYSENFSIETYSNMAVYYLRIGAYKQSLLWFKKAEPLFLKAFSGKKDQMWKLGSLYQSMGVLHNELFLYEQTLNYYRKAFDYFKHSDPASDQVKTLVHNLASTFVKQKEFDQALELYQESDSLFRMYNDYAYQGYYQGLAELYYEKEDYNTAIEYLEKALALWQERFPNDPEVYSTLLITGNVYRDMGNIPQAMHYYGLTEEKLNSFRDRIEENHAYLYYNKSLAHLKQGEFEKAFAQNTQAISSLYPKYKGDQNIYGLPNLGVISNLQLSFNTLSIRAKAFFHYYRESSHDKKDLEHAIKIIKVLLKKITEFQEEAKLRSTQIYTIQYFYEVYELGLQLTHHYIQDFGTEPEILEWANQLFEQSRARRLHSSLYLQEMMGKSQLPDSVLLKKFKLETGIQTFKAQMQSLHDGDREIWKKDSVYRNQLFELEQAYQAYMDSLENLYPDYYEFLHNPPIVSLKELQGELDRDETIVSLFQGKSSLFLFTINKKGVELSQLKMDKDLSSELRLLKELSSQEPQYDTYLKDYLTFTQSASALYKKIFTPIEDQLTQKLIIVPDGEFHGLAFEVLLTEENYDKGEPQYWGLPYFFKERDISYESSGSIFIGSRKKKYLFFSSQNKLLAIAPSFSSQENLKVKDGFVEEVLELGKYFTTEIYRDSSATKQVFFDRAGEHNLIHLSTHGFAEPKLAGAYKLAFSPEGDSALMDFLYHYEVMAKPLEADLVALSACQTGFGEYEKGEGLRSMGGAFRAAGAKSILYSYWKIPDKSTQSIMEEFYSNLAKGEDKDMALKAAKLNYLLESKSQNKHPYYWAGMVLQGNTSSIGQSYIYYVGILALLILAAISYYFIKRRS